MNKALNFGIFISLLLVNICSLGYQNKTSIFLVLNLNHYVLIYVCRIHFIVGFNTAASILNYGPCGALSFVMNSVLQHIKQHMIKYVMFEGRSCPKVCNITFIY